MLGAVRLRWAAAARPAARFSTYPEPAWDARYLQLQAYHAAHGDSAVPKRFTLADRFKLGTWVGTQRLAYKKGELSPERVERLKAVAFVWGAIAEAWDAHFKLLAAYREAHGNCAVPSNFATADGTKLGRWVNTQRKAYNTGKLRPERVERLEAVAFVWDVQADNWDVHFELLTAYRATHGDCAVPQKGRRRLLGSWVPPESERSTGRRLPRRACAT
ncbi:helicase associated domain-containing protein [Pelagophyceae sp. CCMP2097]|nr:helicase associated domain-containing protein [Pelagophyceae sp. CCMP2097]